MVRARNGPYGPHARAHGSVNPITVRCSTYTGSPARGSLARCGRQVRSSRSSARHDHSPSSALSGRRHDAREGATSLPEYPGHPLHQIGKRHLSRRRRFRGAEELVRARPRGVWLQNGYSGYWRRSRLRLVRNDGNEEGRPGPATDIPELLLPRVESPLKGKGSRAIPFPYNARTLRPIRVRQLGTLNSRFLSTGQDGDNLLYLSSGTVYAVPASGGTPQLLARNIADAAFDVDDIDVLARPRPSPDLTHLILINTKSRHAHPFALPGGAMLLAPNAGIGPLRIADAMSFDHIYVSYRIGERIGEIDPQHPARDRFLSAAFLPPASGQLIASCSEHEVALAQPRAGLVISSVPDEQGAGGTVVRRTRARTSPSSPGHQIAIISRTARVASSSS